MSTMAYAPERAVPLAELVGGLALACDLANGMPPEKVLRTAIIATRIAAAARLGPDATRDAYWVTILRFLGCTAFSHEEAHVYGAGDDTGTRRVMAFADFAQPARTLRQIATKIGRGGAVLDRARAVATLLTDRAAVEKHARAQCDSSVAMARILGLSRPIQEAIAQVCERFDGQGKPQGARGDAIALAARVLHVADVAELAHHRMGEEGALAEIARRAGGHLDPALARAFLDDAPAIFDAIGGGSVWERFLAAEPAPIAFADADRADDVAFAFACFADLKSVYTVGHSVRVAALATEAARASGLPTDAVRDLRRAALLHDLGRVSVPTGIWDKPGALGFAEWERVRLHAYYTERIVLRAPAWAPAARIAAAAHERVDGTGYPSAKGSGSLPQAAKILAAADVLAALLEPRPHRPARGLGDAARVLDEEIAAGRLDRSAAHAVLIAAGAPRPPRPPHPCGLSDREVEVLRLVARGKTNKEIGQLLEISARTVQNHVAHIYDKIGVYSRAGAALFVTEHALLE